MARVLSGVQPTGDMHLGGYLGAFRHWAFDQHEHDSYFCVVDLHALTSVTVPAELRARTLEVATILLAVGLDPAVCTLFVQSHVPAHTELSWLLECTASFGELGRMTQFKDKAAGREQVPVGLFTYPVLMAADILAYDSDLVPVGDDQRQHLELTRELALRFNHRYGDTFVVPEAAIPKLGARVMDLQNPTRKMSKSEDSPQGTVLVLDGPDVIRRKIGRAVTDPGSEVVYDPPSKPGVSNLLELLAAATGRDPVEVGAGYERYAPLKADVAEAVIDMLRPVQGRYRQLEADPGFVSQVLAEGAAKAEMVATATLSRAREALGLLPRRRR